ncbi:hypothetical protein [Streptomyces sp. NPDC054794]
MPSRRSETRLAPHARLPRTYHDRHIAHSTVDAFGRAHWLLTERETDPCGTQPYDALVVTVEDGTPYETHLGGILPRCDRVEVPADGGFVPAAARAAPHEVQIQVFDALGRPSWTFRVGDGIEHLLADEAGDLWVGHFDEGIVGDELSAAGLRRWSGTGEPLWEYRPVSGSEWFIDCSALNVARRAVWSCPYPRFPLPAIRDDRVVRVRANPVRGASGLAVRGERLVFFGGFGDDHDRIVDCRLTEEAVEPVTEGRLLGADGGALGRRRIVCRGARLHVQVGPFTEWTVLDLE